MHRRRTPILIALLILVAHLIPSTAAASGRRGPTIVDLAQGSPELSILVEAAVRTGLDKVLASGSPFTVFAPTNEAFEALLAAVELEELLRTEESSDPEEMDRVFNMGLGLVLVVSPFYADSIRDQITRLGLGCWTIGRVTEGDGSVAWA